MADEPPATALLIILPDSSINSPIVHFSKHLDKSYDSRATQEAEFLGSPTKQNIDKCTP